MPTISDLGLERLWTHARLLMLTATIEGEIVSANPAWTDILGWPVEQIIGRNFFDLVHPDDLERTRVSAAALAKGRQVPTFANRFRTESGAYRDIDWTVITDGELIHALGRDETIEKAHAGALSSAEDGMWQAQKMDAIGQLTGGVAHDFNNLLTVITGAVELLRRPNITNERRTRYIDAIGETADRAAKLTGQLLAFARRQALMPELFDVGASLTEVAAMVRTLTGSRVELELSLPDEPVFVMADRSQFDTSIVNIAINARDAMDGDGRLSIAVDCCTDIPTCRAHVGVAGNYVAVSITDTGLGMSDATMTRIFEPFFTTKKVGEGTGLGLSQVIGFAKQSGGDIRVESVAGEGTTFTLYLPLDLADGPVKLVLPEANVLGAGMCVLLVEDNDMVGEFATDAMRELGYDSVLVPNAELALAALREDCDRFAIVFSDVVMPGMSGVELGQQIRTEFPQVPVILASGYSHILAEDTSHGFELLHKPYSIEQLSRVLQQAVALQVARGKVRGPVPSV